MDPLPKIPPTALAHERLAFMIMTVYLYSYDVLVLHVFVFWTSECDCWSMLTCFKVWTVSPDQCCHSLTYTCIDLFPGQPSIVI